MTEQCECDPLDHGIDCPLRHPEHVHDWMAWRHIDADRFLTDTIMFFKCRDCNKRLEVSEVEARLNDVEKLIAEDVWADIMEGK